MKCSDTVYNGSP